MVRREDGASPLLEEMPAKDEAQLQELIKDNPDLLPIEDFGMAGPLMMVGRETTLPSGAVDLVGVTRGANILVIEFKTGPQNTDFRHALSQLLDYGSDIWGMSYEEFESAVTARYFASDRCRDPRVKGKTSLQDAMHATWPDMSEEDVASLLESLQHRLAAGAFAYVLVAQRFTDTVGTTVQYLNAVTRGPRFYAVGLVHFAGEGISAFESRTVLKPGKRGPIGPGEGTNEREFLGTIQDHEYSSALQELFAACRGLGLRFEWQSVGTSIRVATPDSEQPISLAWVFPPGKSGYRGLTDLTLGFGPSQVSKAPRLRGAFDRYVAKVAVLSGAEPVKAQSLEAYRLPPNVAISLRSQMTETIAELVKEIHQDRHL